MTSASGEDAHRNWTGQDDGNGAASSVNKEEVNSALVTEAHLDGDLPIRNLAVLDMTADRLNLEPIQIPQ